MSSVVKPMVRIADLVFDGRHQVEGYGYTLHYQVIQVWKGVLNTFANCTGMEKVTIWRELRNSSPYL